jgi:tape measure domain-containing protein
MADKVGSVYIEIQAKMGTLEKDLKTLEQRMQGVDGKAKQTASSFASMGSIIASAGITGAVIGLGKAALKASAEMEQNRVAFTTMLGSADKATKLLKEMTDFASNTPFELPEIQNAGKKLLAMGVAANSIIPTLTKLGDVSAALSIPIGELSDIYGKMKTSNLIQAEELNQLASRGIPVFTELAKVMGVNADQVKKMGSEGKITFKELDQAFTNMTAKGSQFGGMMEAQSKTLAGQWSNFQDTLGKIAVIMGDEIAPATKTWLTLASNLINIVSQTKSEYPKINTSLLNMLSPLKAILDYNTWIFDKINDQFEKGKSVTQIIDEQNRNVLTLVENFNKGAKGSDKIKKSATDSAAAYKKLADETKRWNDYLSGAANPETPESRIRAEIAEIDEHQAAMDKAWVDGKVGTDEYNAYVVKSDQARANKQKELDALIFEQRKQNALAVMNVAGGLASQLSNLANMSASNETARIDNELTQQKEALDAKYAADVAAINAELISQEEKDAKLKALDEKKARETKALEDAAAKEKRRIVRENAILQKKLQIFQVMITTPQAAMAAFSALAGIPLVGPALGGIAAAATIAMGLKQIQLIEQQPLPALAAGGIVPAVPGGNQFTLGEGGSAEAVIPLNDATLGKLAGMINKSGGSQSMNITLQVDGEKFANWIYSGSKSGNIMLDSRAVV